MDGLQANGLSRREDRHWIYYTGSNERHWPGGERWREHPCQLAIGLATLPLDRFVCLAAKDAPGTVETKPFLFEGSKLIVNVDAQRGEMAVEVLDQNGQPVPGFTRNESHVVRAVDELRLQPRWDDHVDRAALQDKVVRLKFQLPHARLFAFQVQ